MHFLHLKSFDCSCLRVADCDQPSRVHVALAVRAYQRRHFQCKTNNMLSDYRYPQFPNHPAASSAVTANEARWISQGHTSGLTASLSCWRNHAFMKEKQGWEIYELCPYEKNSGLLVRYSKKHIPHSISITCHMSLLWCMEQLSIMTTLWSMGYGFKWGAW